MYNNSGHQEANNNEWMPTQQNNPHSEPGASWPGFSSPATPPPLKKENPSTANANKLPKPRNNTPSMSGVSSWRVTSQVPPPLPHLNPEERQIPISQNNRNAKLSKDQAEGIMGWLHRQNREMHIVLICGILILILIVVAIVLLTTSNSNTSTPTEQPGTEQSTPESDSSSTQEKTPQATATQKVNRTPTPLASPTIIISNDTPPDDTIITPDPPTMPPVQEEKPTPPPVTEEPPPIIIDPPIETPPPIEEIPTLTPDDGEDE